MSALSPRQLFLLDAGCAPLRNEFPGYGPYLVGTAAHTDKEACPRCRSWSTTSQTRRVVEQRLREHQEGCE